ncbi:MAG: cellulase family glycosylhydrolase [Acidimicrobiia bacterium]|nr:cellulase family glycosylhydrolase [Acidimicrobiia bacterium]
MSSDTGAGDHFRLGVNYWPARSAMRWWSAFEPEEVARDFERIADAGMDSVRFFLTWEAFQPAPASVDQTMLGRLVQVADIAEAAGLDIMPTLFTGHMSGVNLIPPWATGGSDGDDRFRVVSGGSASTVGLRNWYSDPHVTRAQTLLAGQAAGVLAGHGSVWAWDLGNENSNCVTPPDKASGREWLMNITSAIRAADPKTLITTGLHMEDLEQDRNLGPAEAQEACDFLTMHGYPIYASWSAGPTDEHLLPFLSIVTRWLAGRGDVLFSEFGLPTLATGDNLVDHEVSTMSVREEEAAAYTGRCLEALHDAGCTGAMLWCYSDYLPGIWSEPPLDVAIHERSFGLWRSDGSPKPAVEIIKGFGNRVRRQPSEHPWIDIEPEQFWAAPAVALPRLYNRFRAARDLSPSMQ